MEIVKTTKGRRALILQKLKKQASVSVAELHEEFGVSEVTIRKDLNDLFDRNLLILHARRGHLLLEQREQGRYADQQQAFFQHPGEAGHRTAGRFAHQGGQHDHARLGDHDARNRPQSGAVSSGDDHHQRPQRRHRTAQIQAFQRHPAGRQPARTVAVDRRAVAESNLKVFYSDKLFLGVDSFNIECGLSTPNIEEANINQVMLSMASEVVAVFDSSKVNKRSFAFIAPVDKIDVIVTDSNLPANVRTQLKSMDIKLHIADV